jgi:hypothetical protein
MQLFAKTTIASGKTVRMKGLHPLHHPTLRLYLLIFLFFYLHHYYDHPFDPFSLT